VFAERDDATDDQYAGPAVGGPFRPLADLGQGSDQGFLRRQRAVIDDRGRLVGRTAVGDELVDDLWNLLRTGVAEERAVQARRPFQSTTMSAATCRPRSRESGDRVAAA
jgi:hypothetical protein